MSHSEWRVLSLELKAMKQTGLEWKDCGAPRKVLDCGMLSSAKSSNSKGQGQNGNEKATTSTELILQTAFLNVDIKELALK